MIAVCRVLFFSYSIATVAFDSVDIAVCYLGNNADMIGFAVWLPVEEDNHTRLNELVIIGTVDFRAVNPQVSVLIE